jgi:PIN domain nuclease of toxin-antitoxin system
MTYLLDTVAFYRALDKTLPAKLLRRLQRSDSQLFVSIVTPWEIALKPALQAHGMSNELVQEKILELGARLLPITMEHTGLLYTLPYFEDHRDPFDRMLIAQALDERCPLVSNDQRFARYQARGLSVIWD